MGRGIVLREPRPAPLMTRELRRRARLSPLEVALTYWPVLMTVVGSIVSIGSLVGVCVSTRTLVDVFGGVGIGLGATAGAWGIGWWAMATDKNEPAVRTLDRRQRDVNGIRTRKHRAHRDDDRARLKELKYDYSRYSVQVRREGEAVELRIAEHTFSGGWPVRWETTVSKRGHTLSGEFASGPINRVSIMQPTLEQVQTALQEMSEAAAALEARAYREALASHRLDVLVLTVDAPPASIRAHAAVEREEFEAEVEQALLDEGS